MIIDHAVLISLPWPPKRLSPNWTGKLKEKLRAKKHYRNTCATITASQLTNEMTECVEEFGDVDLHLELRFFPPHNYRYDRDNLVARCKHGIDGMCSELGIDDRRFRYGSDGIYERVVGGQVDLVIRVAELVVVVPAVCPWS